MSSKTKTFPVTGEGGFSWLPCPIGLKTRATLLDWYPALGSNREYRQIAEYQIFSAMRDEGKPYRRVMPHETICRLVGRSSCVSGELLAAFSRDVWELNPSEYHSNQRARTVDLLPRRVSLLLAEPDPSPTVEFVSGRERKARYWREEHRPKTPCDRSISPSDPRYALWVLLDVKSNKALTTTVNRNMRYARAMMEAMPQGTDAEVDRKGVVAATLNCIALNPLPLYQSVERTQRVYTMGVSMVSLPRGIRKCLLSGSITLDARAMQLAIIAAKWPVPQLHDRLVRSIEKGTPIWTELLCEMGYIPDDDSKDALKTAVYALCYGGGIKTQGESFRSAGLNPEGFHRHPLIKAMRKASKQRQEAIKEAGGMQCPFSGQWWSLEGDAAYRLLAREAQSWELRLMMSAVNEIHKIGDRDRATLLLWLHDGFTINVGRRESIPCVVRRLQAAFNEAAMEQGIPTRLERE